MKLTKRTAFQTRIASELLAPDEVTTTTLVWNDASPADIVGRIDAALAGDVTKGNSVALHSIRRALVDGDAVEPLTVEPGEAADEHAAITAEETEILAAADHDGAPTFDPDPEAMAALAKTEWADLKTWTKDGENPPRPHTPNLDELNRQNAAGVTAKDRRAAKGGRPRDTVRSIDPTEIGETMTCQGACGQDLAVKKFPTVSGGRRAVECRSCRDGRREARKAS